MSITELKKLSKEEFLKVPNTSEDMYKKLQNSKSGWIKISRLGDGAGEYGMTEAFGEGLACRIDNIDRWYYTSTIDKIDWENNTFTTKNSTYKFSFKPLEFKNI